MSAPRRSACVFAGAGTGKTHGLITECLRLLAGADREEPLLPGELCLLTFTEKAAAEMRGRLAARVDALAAGRGQEPELEAALAAAGRPMPGSADWRRVQLRLSSATLSTFHAFCAALLRRAPPEAGVPPGFQLLDEEESLELLEDAAERRILEALEANDPGVEALCTALDLRGFRRNGLVELLVDQYRRVRDHGHSPDGLLLTTADDVDRALAESRERVGAVLAQATERAAAERAECLPILGAMADLLVGWGPATALDRAARLAELRDALPRGQGRNGLGSALKALRDALYGAASPLGAVALQLARPHEETWKRLLVELEARQRAAFDDAGALDFAELLLGARTLLAGDPAFRGQEQRRIGALLLDEFQDTNRVQLELVHLLAEAREGGPRRLDAAGPTTLPLEPGLVWAVGDRKQSIYDFRGAEVEVFEQLAVAVETQGGERRFLRESRRARPALVELLNGLLPGVLGKSAAHPWEVPFRAGEDDLVAWRPEEGPPRSVERLQAETAPDARAEDRRRAEADLLARRLRRLLLPGEGTLPTPFDPPRPVRGGEVAILLRSFTELPVYTEALARHHVPHRVLRGRGFYASPEVRDAASLLGLLVEPRHPVHLAACLRGPLVGLSDATLLRLALPNGRLDARVLTGGLPPEALPGEAERLARFVAVVRRLRREMDRLSLVELLEEAWSGLGTRAALAAGPHGEEQLGHLERLRQLAARWDAQGRPDVAAFSRRLELLADRDPRLALEEVEDARAGHAVQLLTVHAAKGLEWPVVCVADLGSIRPSVSGRLLVDPREGLAFRPPVPWSADPHPTPRSVALAEVLASREQAESRRVLYVALTRARDTLLLSGVAGKNPRSWAAWVDPGLATPAVAARVVVHGDEDFPPLPSPPRDALPDVEPARVERALERLRPAPPTDSAPVPLSLEALEDAAGCPRRFRLRWVEGHREGPGRGAIAPSSPRHRDAAPALARQLIALLPAASWAEGVTDAGALPALARLGLSPGEASALGILPVLRRIAPALRSLGTGWTWRTWVPVQLELGPAEVRDVLPLLLEGPGGCRAVTVVPGPPGTEGTPATEAVLLAALGVDAGRPVEVASVPLEGGGPMLTWTKAPRLGEQGLRSAATAAVEARHALPEVIPIERCQALGCGFLARCHGKTRGL